MWDLKTIKEINKPRGTTKLWHYLNAWKKFLTKNSKTYENK